MPFFDDFADAVRDYPSVSVTLSIVERAPVPPATPGAVNINEVWSFQVRISNNGHLNLTGVSLGIEGFNGATVATAAAGPFAQHVISPPLAAVNANSTQDTVKLFLKAPSVAMPPGTELVMVYFNAFDANLNHILIDHSGHALPVLGLIRQRHVYYQGGGTYADQVFP